MKQYRVYIGVYNKFDPEYDLQKEFRKARVHYCEGIKEVKEMCKHSLHWDKWNKRWNCFCGDCNTFWITEEILDKGI